MAEDGSIILMLSVEQLECPISKQGLESTFHKQDGIVDDFEHVQMDDADEATGSIQGELLSSKKRPLMHHPMEVGKRDSGGLVQSFATIPSAPVEEGPSTGNGEANSSA